MFISNALGTYQTLVDHLNTRGNFPESVVRFWTAELASGLVYLHSNGIMHRYAS
jgi:serine/threonine protein kinase